MTLCLIFSLSTFAFATNGAHKTVDYIAQDWIDTQFSGDAEVSDTIVLRSDNSGEVVGYIVSFTKQSVPAGYIVLSCEDGEHPIIEFALEGQSVYHYLEQQLNMKLPHFSHFILPQMS